jgi:hypothetical protein
VRNNARRAKPLTFYLAAFPFTSAVVPRAPPRASAYPIDRCETSQPASCLAESRLLTSRSRGGYRSLPCAAGAVDHSGTLPASQQSTLNFPGPEQINQMKKSTSWFEGFCSGHHCENTSVSSLSFNGCKNLIGTYASGNRSCHLCGITHLLGKASSLVSTPW